MKKSYRLIIILVFTFFLKSCYGQKDNTMEIIHQDISVLKNGQTYEVWQVYNFSYKTGGEKSEVHINKGLIDSLPKGVKTIIAHYTSFVPDYLWESSGDTSKDLAKALGGFSSLKNAQKSSLKKWKKNFTLDETNKRSIPYSLYIIETEQSIIFEYSLGAFNKKRDEFKVGSDGKIVQVFDNKDKVLEPIVYDKLRLITYYSYDNKIKLNGEEIEIRNYYLDPENIKSIALCEEDKTVYIEQKNKNPKYFSLSDIDLSQLSYPVSSLSEIRYISLDDGLERGFHDYHEDARIEASAVIGLNSWVKNNVKYLQIKTKLNN